MSERLIPVDHFGQLGTGVVVVARCSCGERHRGMLANRVDTSAGPLFEMLPIPACCLGASAYVVRSQTVEAGNVWRVIDDVPARIETEPMPKKVRAS